MPEKEKKMRRQPGSTSLGTILFFVFATAGVLAFFPASFWPFKLGLGVVSGALGIACAVAAVAGHEDAKQFAWYFLLFAAILIGFHYAGVPQY